MPPASAICPQPDRRHGYRLQGSIRWGQWIFEGVYSHFGDWDFDVQPQH